MATVILERRDRNGDHVTLSARVLEKTDRYTELMVTENVNGIKGADWRAGDVIKIGEGLIKEIN